jgi:hypothetical protein
VPVPLPFFPLGGENLEEERGRDLAVGSVRKGERCLRQAGTSETHDNAPPRPSIIKASGLELTLGYYIIVQLVSSSPNSLRGEKFVESKYRFPVL